MPADRSYLSVAPRGVFSDAAFEILRQLPEMRFPDGDAPMSREEILNLAPTIEGLLVDAIDPVDRTIIDAAPSLRVISSMGAGYDNVDIDAANERGILVCNAPGFSTDNVADHTFGLMIMIAHQMTEHDRLMRAGRFQDVHSQVIFGHRVSGATLGVVGMGTIGTAVARRARAFDMQVLYTSRTPKPGLEVELGIERVDLDDLLRRSDFVSLHVELTSDTATLIGKRELALMKPTAVLVNTSRGGVVDTDALTGALADRRILGAGLDVTDPEPLPLDHPLLEMDNVFITPHTGFATHEALAAITEAAAQSLLDVYQGKRPQFLVNPGALKRDR